MKTKAIPTESPFSALGLRPELVAALAGLGYEEPTPIQREAIPLLLEGKDLLGQAATGTGKTAAFALPILQRLRTGGRVEPQALILVPTRELAVQVSEAIYKYGRDLGVRVVPIYGGQPIGRQLQALARGVNVIVATPGRALDHISRGTLPLGSVEVVVLDEADEMLDMGFADDIEAILAATPDSRQTVLFSATLPPRINGIAKRHQRDPVRVKIHSETVERGQRPLVRHRAYVVDRAHKAAALGRILDVETPAATIVFCRTRTEVEQLSETLERPRLPRRAAARRAEPGAARPRHGADAGRHGRATGGHRRRGARARPRPAHARGQLRRAVGAGIVRAPGRPRRPRRPHRRRDHVGRAARAAAARQHRAADPAEDRDREDPHHRRPARAPDGADLRHAARGAARRRSRALCPGRRRARRRGRVARHRARGGAARARGARRHRRRAGDPRCRGRGTSATAPAGRSRVERAAPGRTGAAPPTARRASTWASAATPASGPATWSARSPTRRGSAAATSGRSPSATASPSSASRAAAIDDVIAAMQGTTFKGRRTVVRRFVEKAR